jgi:hypothetical protein
MKRFMTSFLLVALLGCGNAMEDPAVSPSDTSGSKAPISVSGPMTIARSDLFPLLGENLFLSLQLVEGSYHEDWSPGPFAGRSWTGEFVLKILNDNEEAVGEFPMSGAFAEALVFNDTFEIPFEDYNGDGNADFTIGQYGSSSGDFYKIFTITGDRTIKELPIRGTRELFVSGGANRYSTKLEKLGPGVFRKKSYDNSVAKTIVDTFRWEGEDFVKIDSREEG